MSKMNRSAEELRMRELVVDELRSMYFGARIIHELPLRYSHRRIDLAAVTEEDIIAVEIKSSRDVVDRLEDQLRGFIPVASRIIVALAPKWNPKRELVWVKDESGRQLGVYPPPSKAQEVIQRVGGPVSTWTVCAETGKVEHWDGRWAATHRPWSCKLLDLLWRAELFQVAFEHGVYVPKSAPHATVRDACEAAMTGRQVRRAVCKALRQRNAFDKASDPAEAAA